jgi:hypothetical protein
VKKQLFPCRFTVRFCTALLVAILTIGAAPLPSPPPMVAHWHIVLVAGDTAQPVFDNAVKAMALRLAEHGVPGPEIHRLAASADGRDPAVEPATLKRVLDRIAGLRAQPGDGCFVFITSHGAEDRGVYLARNQEMLRPAALAQALDAGCGQVPTVVVVSACYSGSFARGVMARPNRIVLTAARPDRPSFGCAADRTYTDYDACLLAALPHAPTWQGVFTEARACVRAREHQLGETPSQPQASFGKAVRNLPLQF